MRELEVGPKLDEAVCRALGIAPRLWVIVDRNANWVTSPYAEGSRKLALTLVDEQVGQVERPYEYWPVSTDRTAMWLVWDALLELGLFVELSSNGKRWLARTDDYEGNKSSGISTDSAPEALCRAALAALAAHQTNGESE